MAEEANVTMSDPTTSGAEMKHSQQDNGVNAAEIPVDEGTYEPHKEGTEQEEATNGMSGFKQPSSEVGLTIVFFQPLRLTATQTTPLTPLTISLRLPAQTHKITKWRTLQRPVMPKELNLLRPYLLPTVHLLLRKE